MSLVGRAQLAPILRADLQEVGAFLHAELNPRLSAAEWAWSLVPTWHVDAPNHGYLLRDGGEVVGVQLAFYSRREVEEVEVDFCNLGAWCVREPYRSQGMRMLFALLSQKEYTFTDLSPSGNVVALNRRLHFEDIDTTAAVVPNLPLFRMRAPRVIAEPESVRDHLDDAERRIFDDHRRASATIHLVLVRGDESCYVIVRRDRRKNLPLFASVLHTSDAALLRRWFADLGSHLLRHHHVPLTLVELRHVGGVAPVGAVMRTSRPKMFRAGRAGAVAGRAIDDLYSELTLVAW
jgi:hypothetical protein